MACGHKQVSAPCLCVLCEANFFLRLVRLCDVRKNGYPKNDGSGYSPIHRDACIRIVRLQSNLHRLDRDSFLFRYCMSLLGAIAYMLDEYCTSRTEQDTAPIIAWELMMH